MDYIAELRSGAPEAVSRLARSGSSEWIHLAEHVLDDPTLSPEFAVALWRVLPNVMRWEQALSFALGNSKKVSSIKTGMQVVFPWIRDSVYAAFPPSHDAVFDMRAVDIRHVARDDGGYREACELHDDLVRGGAGAERLTGAKVLAMKGAFTVGDYAEARRFAESALEHFVAESDEPNKNSIERALAGALMHLREWDRALRLLDDALRVRHPIFGSRWDVGVTVVRRIADPEEAVINEAANVARWASADTPEWVRALGALAEAFADEEIRGELSRRFEAGLERIAGSDKPLDGFEVVIRQLRERSSLHSARVAAERGVAAAPDDSWIRSVAGNLARDLGDHHTAYRHFRCSADLLERKGDLAASLAWATAGDAAALLGKFEEADDAFRRARDLVHDDSSRRNLDFYLARSFRERDSASARERAYALFNELAADPALLGNSALGSSILDLLLGLLMLEKSPEAVAVQQRMLDAKLALWGEAPPAWLERHNLGVVYAAFGNCEEARALFEDARQRLRTAFGEAHPHVRRCDASLAKLEGR